MSNRFHNKWHRHNHWSLPVSGEPDSSHDPIASREDPFRGEFHLSGQLSGINGAWAPISYLSGLKTDITYALSDIAVVVDGDIYAKNSLTATNIFTDNLQAASSHLTIVNIDYKELSGFMVSGTDDRTGCVGYADPLGGNLVYLTGVGLFSENWATIRGCVSSGSINTGTILVSAITADAISVSSISSPSSSITLNCNTLTDVDAICAATCGDLDIWGNVNIHGFLSAWNNQVYQSAWTAVDISTGPQTISITHGLSAPPLMTQVWFTSSTVPPASTETIWNLMGTLQSDQLNPVILEGNDTSVTIQFSNAQPIKIGGDNFTTGMIKVAVFTTPYFNTWSAVPNFCGQVVNLDMVSACDGPIDINGDVIMDNLSATQVVVNCGNSNQWCNTYNTVAANSASWGVSGADLSSLTGNWQSTYSSVSTNSACWQAACTEVAAHSGNWNSTYATVCTTSGDWQQNNYLNFFPKVGMMDDNLIDIQGDPAFTRGGPPWNVVFVDNNNETVLLYKSLYSPGTSAEENQYFRKRLEPTVRVDPRPIKLEGLWKLSGGGFLDNNDQINYIRFAGSNYVVIETLAAKWFLIDTQGYSDFTLWSPERVIDLTNFLSVDSLSSASPYMQAMKQPDDSWRILVSWPSPEIYSNPIFLSGTNTLAFSALPWYKQKYDLLASLSSPATANYPLSATYPLGAEAQSYRLVGLSGEAGNWPSTPTKILPNDAANIILFNPASTLQLETTASNSFTMYGSAGFVSYPASAFQLNLDVGLVGRAFNIWSNWPIFYYDIDDGTFDIFALIRNPPRDNQYKHIDTGELLTNNYGSYPSYGERYSFYLPYSMVLTGAPIAACSSISSRYDFNDQNNYNWWNLPNDTAAIVSGLLVGFQYHLNYSGDNIWHISKNEFTSTQPQPLIAYINNTGLGGIDTYFIDKTIEYPTGKINQIDSSYPPATGTPWNSTNYTEYYIADYSPMAKTLGSYVLLIDDYLVGWGAGSNSTPYPINWGFTAKFTAGSGLSGIFLNGADTLSTIDLTIDFNTLCAVNMSVGTAASTPPWVFIRLPQTICTCVVSSGGDFVPYYFATLGPGSEISAIGVTSAFGLTASPTNIILPKPDDYFPGRFKTQVVSRLSAISAAVETPTIWYDQGGGMGWGIDINNPSETVFYYNVLDEEARYNPSLSAHYGLPQVLRALSSVSGVSWDLAALSAFPLTAVYDDSTGGKVNQYSAVTAFDVARRVVAGSRGSTITTPFSSYIFECPRAYGPDAQSLRSGVVMYDLNANTYTDLNIVYNADAGYHVGHIEFRNPDYAGATPWGVGNINSFNKYFGAYLGARSQSTGTALQAIWDCSNIRSGSNSYNISSIESFFMNVTGGACPQTEAELVTYPIGAYRYQFKAAPQVGALQLYIGTNDNIFIGGYHAPIITDPLYVTLNSNSTNYIYLELVDKITSSNWAANEHKAYSTVNNYSLNLINTFARQKIAEVVTTLDEGGNDIIDSITYFNISPSYTNSVRLWNDESTAVDDLHKHNLVGGTTFTGNITTAGLVPEGTFLEIRLPNGDVRYLPLYIP